MKHMINLVIPIAVLLGGCSNDDPVSEPFLPLPPSAAGVWAGDTTGALTVSMQINQDVIRISGSGAITSLTGGGTLNGGLSGTNHYPDVAITISISGFIPIQLTGQFVSPETIVAELNESGFSHFPITFTKK